MPFKTWKPPKHNWMLRVDEQPWFLIYDFYFKVIVHGY